jgi:hypothetical protein
MAKRKKVFLSPKSVAYMREKGYTTGKVEYWNSFANKRVDLFGFIDLLAMKKGVKGLIGIQVTSRSNISIRKRKAESLEALEIWLSSGNRFIIHGWDKPEHRWRLKEEELFL